MIRIISLCALLCVFRIQCRAGETPPEKPNFLILLADNLGYGDLGCYGNRAIRTSHLDRLAAQGVRLTDFYTASPTCTVSRACLLTGRYPQRHGLTYQLPGIEGNYGVGLNQSEVLLPELLRRAGYRCGCFGKWNIGFAPGSRPTERGFHEFLGHASGNIDYYTHVYNGKLDTHRGVESVRLEGYSTDLFADAAIDFIRRHRDERWFAYLPFNAPHFPNPKNKNSGEPCIWQAPDRAFQAYGWSADEKDERRRYHAVVTAMDEAIGRVLKTLDDLKLDRKTVVIFYSDNGAFMLPGRGKEVASNAPLRDGGVTLYEGGIRVPCIVRWPGAIKPGSVCAEPLISLDWLPWLVRLSGGTLPADRTIDGKDPHAALVEGGASPHRAFYFAYGKHQAMRRGQYKLVRPDASKPFALYDLKTDLGEEKDLAQTRKGIAAELEGEYAKWLREVREK
jgi:arylsulfatase A-like enzyme